MILQAQHSGQRTRRQAGFTLFEVMVAIVVMMIAVFAAFASQVNAVNLVRAGRESTIAIADLESAMDAALLVVFDELPIAGSDFADGTSIAAYEDLHLREQRIECDYPGYVAGEALPDPLTIVLTCTWNDYAGRERSLELATMRTR